MRNDEDEGHDYQDDGSTSTGDRGEGHVHTTSAQHQEGGYGGRGGRGGGGEEEKEEESSFHSRDDNSYDTPNVAETAAASAVVVEEGHTSRASASSTYDDDDDYDDHYNDLAKRSPPKHIIRSPKQDTQRKLELQHENALSKILMDKKLAITQQQQQQQQEQIQQHQQGISPSIPLEPPLLVVDLDGQKEQVTEASASAAAASTTTATSPVYHQVNGEMVLVKQQSSPYSSSNNKNNNTKKLTIKNKHWKFVKTTFRQLHLAKALVPRSARTTPISSPVSSPGTTSRRKKIKHHHYHVKLLSSSEDETKQLEEMEMQREHIGELTVKPKISTTVTTTTAAATAATSDTTTKDQSAAVLTDIQLSMIGSSDDDDDDDDDDDYDEFEEEGYNDDEISGTNYLNNNINNSSSSRKKKKKNSTSKKKVHVFEERGNYTSSDDDDDYFQRQLMNVPVVDDVNGDAAEVVNSNNKDDNQSHGHHPLPDNNSNSNSNSLLLRSSPGNSIRKKLRSMVGLGVGGGNGGSTDVKEALPLDDDDDNDGHGQQQESPRSSSSGRKQRRLGVGLVRGMGKKKKKTTDGGKINNNDYKSVSSGSCEFPTSSLIEQPPPPPPPPIDDDDDEDNHKNGDHRRHLSHQDSTTRYYDGDGENEKNKNGAVSVSDSDSDSFFDNIRGGEGDDVDENNKNKGNNSTSSDAERFLQGSGSIDVSIATYPSSVDEGTDKIQTEDDQKEEDADRIREDGQQTMTVDPQEDGAMEKESAHVSVATLDSSYRYARRLLDSSRRKELDAVHQRRKELLQQTTNAEEYICAALGMTRSNGMCTRHINQPIVMTLGGGTPTTKNCDNEGGINDDIADDNDMRSSTSTVVLLCDHAPVWTCRICRSEQQSTTAAATTTRVAPSRTQSSDSMSSFAMIGHQSMQNLGQVVMQLQKLQTDREEWDKRTKLLGESTQINHSHHDEGHDSMSSLGLTDLETNGNLPLNLEGNHSTRSRGDAVDGADKSSRDNLKASLSSLLSAATAVLSDEEWAAQLKRRIIQVRSWDDRFALQHHPHFAPYFKMLSYGIPLEAVKHSVYMDGYDPDVMDLNAKQSLESQIHLLPTEVVENLRSMSAVDIPRSIDGKTGSYGAIPVKELSVSEVVQRVIDSFQERRRNQVFVASALLKEADLMKLVEPRPPAVVNKLDESYRSMLSFEGEEVGNGDESPSAHDKNENTTAGDKTERVGDSLTIEYHTAITKNDIAKEDPRQCSNVPLSDEHLSNARFDTMVVHETKPSKPDMKNLVRSDEISSEGRNINSDSEIHREMLVSSSVEESIEPPSLGSYRKSPVPQKRQPSHSRYDITSAPVPESDSLHSGSPRRRRGSEILLDAAKDSSHFERSILLELVDVLESPGGKSPVASEHSKLITTPNSGSNRLEYRKRRSLNKMVEESPIVNVPILESPTKSDSLVDSDADEQIPPLREVVFDDSRDLDADMTNGTDDDFLSTHKNRLSTEELASTAKSKSVPIEKVEKEGKTDEVPVDLGMLDELKKLRSELAQRDNVVKSMQDEITSLRKQLASKERECTAAETQVSDLYSALAQQGQQYLEKGKELDHVRKLLQEQERTNASIETQLNAMLKEVEQKAAAELIRNKQFDQLRLALKQRVETESDLQKELQISQFETERLELAVDQAEGEIARLQKELEQHIKAEKGLQLAVSERQSELESLRANMLEKQSIKDRNGKDEASRLNADLEEKNKIIDDLRTQLKKKDETIGHLQQKMRKGNTGSMKSIRHTDRKSTPSNNSSTAQVQAASSMKEKIILEKERQAALRKKILSPHRVQPKKKPASKNMPEDARAFQALALSPAGKSRNRIGAQKPNRSQKRNPAAAMPNPPALSSPSLEKGPSTRSSIERSKMNQTPTRSPTIPPKSKEESKRENSSQLYHEDTTSSNSINEGKKSDEEIAKELILNLFDSSISSNQLQYNGGEGHDDGTKTPTAVSSPQRRPVSARTPYSIDRKPVATLTPQSQKVLMSSPPTTTSSPPVSQAPALDSSIQP